MNSALSPATAPLPADAVTRLLRMQREMRDRLLESLRAQEAGSGAGLAEVAGGRAGDASGDTIYRIDERGEEVLLRFCAEWAREGPLALIAEGIPDAGWRVFPEGVDERDARFLLIVDPIDGTRNIMYNKRSAWILAGIAPNRGRAATLADIEVAAMTEIPTTRALLADQLWATRGGGAHRRTQNLLTGEWTDAPIRPSQAPTLAHGFASIAKFFPAAKAATAAFEERLLARVAPDEGGNPVVFDDQYISTGGQIYELLVGHDRFVADLRPLFFERLGLPGKLVCHPYDICTELIAREAGLIVTAPDGRTLDAPLDIRAPVAWTGYANAALRDLIQPHLTQLLAEPALDVTLERG